MTGTEPSDGGDSEAAVPRSSDLCRRLQTSVCSGFPKSSEPYNVFSHPDSGF